MFGMGLGEILFIAVIAIVFLGPEKLPDAMIKTAKFFRAVKKHLTEAKTALDQEINLSQLKSDALEYKQKLTDDLTKTDLPKTDDLKKAIDSPKIEETSREVRDLFSDLAGNVKKIDDQIKNA
ncbi:MAG: Sec-independent protein translocase protein TatB [Helicobacteraceae bacterium]|jgi:sec-independent protein translocase protein TatB|nr:Sec-independent protein translocase protein TatB [Helicobacteraceae bacterium]